MKQSFKSNIHITQENEIINFSTNTHYMQFNSVKVKTQSIKVPVFILVSKTQTLNLEKFCRGPLNKSVYL